MTETIEIDVSDLHGEMFDEVRTVAGEHQVRQQVENLVHSLYQEAELKKEQQQAASLENGTE